MDSAVDMDEIAFVDIQGFKDIDNNFILKEVFIHTVAENTNYHAIIESPFQFHRLNQIERRQIQWITNNHHGICWDAGGIALTQFLDDMKSVVKEKVVICKGDEKLKWLQIFFERISIKKYINCEDLNCNFKLSQIRNHFDACYYHKKIKKHNFICALKTVMKLREWYFEEYIFT